MPLEMVDFAIIQELNLLKKSPEILIYCGEHWLDPHLSIHLLSKLNKLKLQYDCLEYSTLDNVLKVCITTYNPTDAKQLILELNPYMDCSEFQRVSLPSQSTLSESPQSHLLLSLQQKLLSAISSFENNSTCENVVADIENLENIYNETIKAIDEHTKALEKNQKKLEAMQKSKASDNEIDSIRADIKAIKDFREGYKQVLKGIQDVLKEQKEIKNSVCNSSISLKFINKAHIIYDQLHMLQIQQQAIDCSNFKANFIKCFLKPIQKSFELKLQNSPKLQNELKMGIEIEFEHTNDIEIATLIAKHHLLEFSEYYTNLIKMEAKMEKEQK